MADQVDLLKAFVSFSGFRAMLQNLIEALNGANSAAVAVLALEGLFRIEAVVRGRQFDGGDMFEDIREYLRKWRCDSPLNQAYSGAYGRVVPFLRSLSIFETLDVPLFIDDYGQKQLLSSFSSTENIPIDLDTPIVHVTHSHEAQQIVNAEEFQPSDNKNILKGIWFSPKCQLGSPPSSVYGRIAFQTTLAQLGVKGLRRGEIVFYKKEVNVILYASDTVVPPDQLQRPTDEAVKALSNAAYVNVSIFVPTKFLQIQGDTFKAVVRRPYAISHSPFCVKQMRDLTGNFECDELGVCTSTQWISPATLESWISAT